MKNLIAISNKDLESVFDEIMAHYLKNYNDLTQIVKNECADILSKLLMRLSFFKKIEISKSLSELKQAPLKVIRYLACLLYTS